MKKSASIIVLAFVSLGFQACGPKSTESQTEVAAIPVTGVKVLTLEQKREKIERDRVARANRMNQEREALANATPYYTDAKGNVIYNKAELAPTYTGGNEALTKYLNDNLKYPETARANEEEGTVFVDFIVEKNGTVREVEITDAYNVDIDQSFRDEAYRVVSNMPRWTPGSQHGKNVYVKYSLPITFQLR